MCYAIFSQLMFSSTRSQNILMLSEWLAELCIDNANIYDRKPLVSDPCGCSLYIFYHIICIHLIYSKSLDIVLILNASSGSGAIICYPSNKHICINHKAAIFLWQSPIFQGIKVGTMHHWMKILNPLFYPKILKFAILLQFSIK